MTTPTKYQEFVKVGNFTKGERDAEFLAAMGLCGEAGEVSEHVKKHLLHGKDLDLGLVKEELGDVLWYFFHALNVFGFTFEEVAEMNVRKLCDRHPVQYGNSNDWLNGQRAGGFLDSANEMTS